MYPAGNANVFHQVVRMSYRQLTSEEETLEASVLSSWEMFLFQLQDAMEFVNTQRPLMARNLEDKLQVVCLDIVRDTRFSTCLSILVMLFYGAIQVLGNVFLMEI